MEVFLQQVRVAARSLRRRPGFTATAVLTIGLGIGATTAILALTDAALLQPLPFPKPDGLQMVDVLRGPDRVSTFASFVEVREWQRDNRAFETLSVYDEGDVSLTGNGQPAQVPVEVVSPSYFDLLGIRPALGRSLEPQDEQKGSAPVVLISDALWRSRFGADATVVGRSIAVGGGRATVIGVLPPAFSGISQRADIWATVAHVSTSGSDMEDRGSRWVRAVGRLKPGFTQEQAAAELRTISTERGIPNAAELVPALEDMRSFYLARTRPLVLTLLGAVLLLALIAGANVMNLQLARATGRTGELAVMRALGATEWRVARLILLEGMWIAVAGAVTGIAIAAAGVGALVPLIPPGMLPAHADVSLNARVLLLASSLAGACGLLFGAVPAFASRERGTAGIVRSGRSSAGWGRGAAPNGQALLVVTEIALAALVLIGAGLLGRSFAEKAKVEPGMDRDVLVARVSVPGSGEESLAFVTALQQRVAAIPGVTEAALGSDAPLRQLFSGCRMYRPETPDAAVRCYRHRVTHGYFETLGNTLRAGRDFDARDHVDAEPVAVLSAAAAQKLFGSENPVGRTVRSGNLDLRIIGVAGDIHTRYFARTAPDPASGIDLYLPVTQARGGNMDLLVRTDVRAETIVPALRGAVAELSGESPLYDVDTMGALLDRQTATDRFGAALLIVFGALALALAAVGIYGVMAFAVGRRTREIAVRLAVGAAPVRVLRMVLGEGLALALAGIVLGCGVAFGAASTLRGFLYGVPTHDVVTFASVPMVLAVIAAAAAIIPAVRAARVEPQVALRAE